MTFNLLAAMFWLVLGLVLIVLHGLYPDQPALDIAGTGVSIGWIALLLTLYNLARWWSTRSATAVRRLEEAQDRRMAQHEAHGAPPAPDPNFDFSKPPPQPEGGRPEGR